MLHAFKVLKNFGTNLSLTGIEHILNIIVIASSILLYNLNEGDSKIINKY